MTGFTRIKSLVTFCELELEHYGTAIGLTPKQVADDFVLYFEVSELPDLEEMCTLASEYGFGTPKAYPLPGDLRAFHHRLPSGDYELLYRAGMYTGTQVFSVLHDMYEQIFETFADLEPSFECPASPGPLCRPANRFAALVLMRDEMFRPALFETGFDLVAMHHRFCQAYKAVAIRALEVLNDGGGPDIFTAVCEHVGFKDPETLPLSANLADFRVVAAGSTKKLLGRKRRLRNGSALMPPHVFFPQTGDEVQAGSIVEQAIVTGRPVYVEKVSGLDLWGGRDMTFIAQPVMWYGVIAKVVLVGLRIEDSHLIQAQLQRCQPWVIPQRFQWV